MPVFACPGRGRFVPAGSACDHGEVERLPSAPPDAEGPNAHSGGGGLERRRGAELTPAERATRRRNRQWLSIIAVPGAIIGGVTLLITLDMSRSGPSVRPVSVPAGYKAVNDGYFAYAVPTSWSQNIAYSDDVGDLDTSGQSGWVAEHVDARPGPPTPGETPPAVFATFGEPRPVPYRIGSATPVRVPDATQAYRYRITRPGGFTATAIDAWIAQSGAEVWLMIYADPATTATVAATLKA